MKKIIIAILLVLLVAGAMAFAKGWCALHGSYNEKDCSECGYWEDVIKGEKKPDSEKKSKAYEKIKETYEDSKTVGEFIGVISAYATNADNFNEFADNVRTHEFQSESLQKAQEWGKDVGDFVADVYIQATSD